MAQKSITFSSHSIGSKSRLGWLPKEELKASEKEPNILIYFFFPPITQLTGKARLWNDL